MAGPRKHPDESRARAVRMVREIDERGAIKRVAYQLDINPGTLRNSGTLETSSKASRCPITSWLTLDGN